MKKLIIVLVLLLAATALFGQIRLGGTFPSAKFLDAQNDAVWEFSANNIRILNSKTGDVEWDFAGKTIKDFVTADAGRQVQATFSCPEAGRSYKFTTALPGTDLVMEIARDGLPDYKVTMPKQ